MPTEKVYSIKIELGQAQQQLDAATKALTDLKVRAAAANQEQREAKQVYDQNTAALRELVQAQKALQQAQKAAGAGEPALLAAAAAEKNLAAQQRLNKVLAESRIDFQNAKEAAAAAGQAVGKQATTVRELAASVKEYDATAKAAGQDFAPGTFGAIGQEINDLKAELAGLVPESKEAAEAIQKIADKESALRKTANALAARNPEAQAKAFGLLTAAIGGTVGVATTCAQVFGLSEKTAAEYTQRMQQLTGVLASVDAVSRLLNGENLALVKSIYTGAKAWLGFGEAAQAGSKAARIGLASTGVGLLVLALGALIALFMDLGSTVKESGSNFTRYKSIVVGGFDSMISLVKDFLKYCYQLATLDFSGAVKTAAEAGQNAARAYADGRNGVIEEALRKEAEAEAKHYERLLKIEQAAGVDTENMERELLRKKIVAQKKGSDEQKEAIAELATFNKATAKRHHEEMQALTLAHLNRLLGLEQAHGRETYAVQLQIEEQRLQFLTDAPKREAAAIAAQQGVIAALKVAHQKEVNDKLYAAQLAAIEGRTAMEEAKGEDAFGLQMKREEKLLNQLLTAGTKDAAAIQTQRDAIALLEETHAQELEQRRRARQTLESQNTIALLEKDGQDTIGLRIQLAELLLGLDKDASTKERTQREADYQKLLELQADYNAKVKAGLQANQQQREEQAEQGRQTDQKFIAAGLAAATQTYEDELTKKKPDLGLKLIKAFFGLSGEGADKLKQELSESFGQLYQAGQQIGGAFLEAAMQETERALADAQLRLQVASQQLSDLQSKADSDSKALETAQGARRDYLLSRLAREREEISKIAAAKAKAAADEKRQQEEQHRLQKIGLELSAAAALAANIAAAAKAVDAGVTAIASAAQAPFPATIPSIIAAIATVVATVASARQLATAVKYEAGTGALGEDGVLRGPSHAGGGIQIFGRGGAHYGEAEGGEAITPRDASARNAAALALIRTAGRTRTLSVFDYMQAFNSAAAGSLSIAPAPRAYYEPGGVLNKSGVAGGQASATDISELATRLDRNNQLLAQLVASNGSIAGSAAATEAHAATTAANTEEIKRKPTAGGGPRSPEEVMKEQEMMRGIEAAKELVTL